MRNYSSFTRLPLRRVTELLTELLTNLKTWNLQCNLEVSTNKPTLVGRHIDKKKQPKFDILMICPMSYI